MLGVWPMFAPGAHVYVPRTNSFFDKKGVPVIPRICVPDSFLLLTYANALACSVYRVRQSDTGAILPWVRFSSEIARQHFKLEAIWLHLDFDFVHKAIWPGLIMKHGIIRASKKTKRLIKILIEQLCVGPLAGATWYLSRGGLHVMRAIQPVPVEWYRDRVLALITKWKATWEQIFLSKNLNVHLDLSCAQPFRLMYMPKINKPGQGQLDLPLEVVNQSTPLTLPASVFKVSDSRTTLTKKRLTKDQVRYLRRFAKHWLQSHQKWLLQAKPGDGINNRMYAFGGDVRQFSAIQLIDKQYWIQVATRLIETFIDQDRYWSAFLNGFDHGVGSDSLAIGLTAYRSTLQQRQIVSSIVSALEELW